MRQYLDLLTRVLDEGTTKSDRTGTGTLSVFGHQMRFDLAEGFPAGDDQAAAHALGHRRAAVVPARRDQRRLAAGARHQHLGRVGRRGRASSARSTGTSGGPGRPRTAGSVDQIAAVIEQIRTNPDSRRHIVSAWNVGDLEAMALPPCHALFQFYVADGRLSCQLYQRSGDVFLGVPFNIASYAMLTMMVAQVCDLEPGDFVHTLGDAHLYLNHLDQARLQLTREPRPLPPAAAQPRAAQHRRVRPAPTSSSWATTRTRRIKAPIAV